jgi:hypothetical protein
VQMAYYLRTEGEREIPVTVCVAAMAELGGVVGASDRMITAGDVQFEPDQGKIWEFTTSIAVMTAGDSSLQTEILLDVYSDVRKRIEAEPTNWWLLKDVAELYSYYYGVAKRKRSERAVLAPLGLTHDSFVSRQSEMIDSFVRMVSTELINFSMPPVATIITGSDPTGTHIYVVTDGDIECVDKVGFAAIGIGRWHANSQFMFAQHDGSKPFPETLLLTFAAKKRAEVSPGVGEGTDMFSIGQALGSYVRIRPDIIGSLEKMYKRTKAANQKAIEKSNEEVRQYVQNLVGTTSPQEVKPEDGGGGATPANPKELRDGAKESEQKGHTTGGKATETGS